MATSIKELEIKIGDTIRDIEDGDCYYEGIVTSINKDTGNFTYLCTRVFWCGEEEELEDSVVIGKIIDRHWYWIEIIK